MRRVVVSGMGAVTALGCSLQATVAALRRGDTGVAPSTNIEVSGFGTHPVAEVNGFEPRALFRIPKALKLTNRPTQFAVAAATMALQDACWPRDSSSLTELGVVVGTSGCDPQAAELARAVGRDPERRTLTDMPFFAERILTNLNPLWLLIGLPNMTSSHVAIQLQAQGPNSSITNDWVAGLQAIGEGSDWIRHGEATAVLAGGADSAIFPHAYASYSQGGLLDAPSGLRRSRGFIPGEGAAVVLLEERDHALRRHAPIHGEVCGYGAASSAPGVCDTSTVAGLDVTLEAALREAGWAASSVDEIGSSVVPSDRLTGMHEAALQRAFGHDADSIPRRTHFDRLGHSLAAGGAIEAALLLALHEAPAPRRLLMNALGYSGQAITLALAGPDAATGDGGAR